MEFLPRFQFGVEFDITGASFEAGGPRVAMVSLQDNTGRFAGLPGSAVWAGRISLEEADGMRATDGESFAEARRAVEEVASIAPVPPSSFRRIWRRTSNRRLFCAKRTKRRSDLLEHAARRPILQKADIWETRCNSVCEPGWNRVPPRLHRMCQGNAVIRVRTR